jgi:RND superfamily putative drug exporter
MKMNVQSLARSSSKHPWRVLIVWGIVLVASGILSKTLLAGSISNSFDFTNNPPSKQAKTLIQDAFGIQPDTEIVIVSSPNYTVKDPQFQQYAAQLAADIKAIGPSKVTNVVNPLALMGSAPGSTGSPTSSPAPSQSGQSGQSGAFGGIQLVSQDGHHLLIPVTIAGQQQDAVNKVPALQDVIHQQNSNPNFQVLVFGQGTAFADNKTLSEQDLKKGETFGIIIALIVLVVVFGALVAAGLPIIMGLFDIAVALGLMAFLGIWFHFVFFTTNMITMMGLAVGIDYSLFVVSRFREERRHGLEKSDALSITGGTANRAVFFSGMTVVFALGGMMIMPTTIFRGLSSGAILVVSVSVAASLTLLPALLSLLGDRINWPRLSRRAHVERGEMRSRMWDTITRGVMGHPVVSLVLAATFLIALALPYFTINTGMSGVQQLPNSLETKQAFVLMEKYFSGGLSQPLEVVVKGDASSPEVQKAIATLQSDIKQNPAFGEIGQLTPSPKMKDVSMFTVAMAGDPQSPASVDAVGQLRNDYIPSAFQGTGATALVSGVTSMMYDFFKTTDQYTPWIFAFVLGLSFILLTIVFRSIVVPTKAIIMNLLSVGAAYGLVVAVFQHGWGESIFHAIGFQYIRVQAIDTWLPLFMFSILFGLSMDYQVFLLSRIREEYDRTGDNGESVAFGLRTTGAIITGAALIMVAVFASFSHGRLVMLQEMGFGLAVAVFLDATVVRSVLVPSAMKLLGDANWYLPKWLQWIPKVSIEGESGRHLASQREAETVSAGTGE